MRKPFIAGNWKMNMGRKSAVELAEGVKDGVSGIVEAEVAVCPPFVYLADVAETLKGSKVGLGAQNCFYEEKGAFTGEVSPEMLKDVGCTWVILGHSERRHVIGEKDGLINKKVVKALGSGMKVILCVGELLEQREGGETEVVVREQVEKGLAGLSEQDMRNVVIAYEPVWAIGTGVNATAEQAQEVHGYIRGLVSSMFGDAAGEGVRIQYGGSVKPSNATELLSEPDVDGGLIGGASLDANSFVEIVKLGALAKK